MKIFILFIILLTMGCEAKAGAGTHPSTYGDKYSPMRCHVELTEETEKGVDNIDAAVLAELLDKCKDEVNVSSYFEDIDY